MRKLILTEDDKNYILGLYNSKVILSEGGLSKFFGEMPWYYYVENIYNEFCEIETYGIPIFFLISVR
jgi:hypothetical protein